MGIISNKNDHIHIKGERQANWYYNYMVNTKIINESNFNICRNPEDKSERVLNALEFNFNSNNSCSPEDYVKFMVKTFHEQTLNNDDISWIDKNDGRLCYWVWSFFRTGNHLRKLNLSLHNEIVKQSLETSKLLESNSLPPVYPEIYKIEQTPINTKERYYSIIYFLDIFQLGVESKRALLQIIRNWWLNICSSDTKLNWMERENENDADFIFRYFKKNKINTEFIIATNTKERYIAIQGIIDISEFYDKDGNTDKETRLHFIYKLRKARNEQRRRENNKRNASESKVNNTDTPLLSKRSKKMILELSQTYNIPPKKLLESILEITLRKGYRPSLFNWD